MADQLITTRKSAKLTLARERVELCDWGLQWLDALTGMYCPLKRARQGVSHSLASRGGTLTSPEIKMRFDVLSSTI